MTVLISEVTIKDLINYLCKNGLKLGSQVDFFIAQYNELVRVITM